MYVNPSDCGPDQVYAKKLAAVIVGNTPNVFFFSSVCYEHQSHLIVKGGLKLIDIQLKQRGAGWKYYSSIAKLCNVMREKSKDVYRIWCRIFGSVDAAGTVMKMVPKCDSGRWGSVEEAEARLLALGSDKLNECLRTALITGEGMEVPALVDDGPDDAVNSLSVEQNQSYSKMMGRWRRECLECIADKRLWLVMRIMHTVREPVLHFSRWLKKPLSEATLNAHGGHLAQLACGKAAEIHSGLSILKVSEDRHELEGIFAEAGEDGDRAILKKP